MRKRGSLYGRLAAIMLVLAMLFGMTGCRMFRKSKAEQVVEYMNAKYDDEFTFKYYYAGDSTSLAYLSSKKFPDANIQANCSRKKDGTCYDFIDNYVKCKYEDQTREFLQDFFEDVFECEVFVNYGIGTGFTNNKDELTNDTTFDQFIHAPKTSFTTVSVISSSCGLSNQQIEKNLKNGLIKENMRISFLFCDFVVTEEDFQSGKVGKSYKAQKTLKVVMPEKNKFTVFEWSDEK